MIKLEVNHDTYWFKLEDVFLVERLRIYTSDYAELKRGPIKIRITLKNTNTNTNTKTIELIVFDPDGTKCDKILSFLEVPDKNADGSKMGLVTPYDNLD